MRPHFHFTAESGWINDPHGIMFRDGRYHLFYQHVPGSLDWAPNCHWGHASSVDLFSFEHHPHAIAPGEGDDGIWTGSVVADGDSAVAFYTAISTPDFGIGRVRVARPVDDGWRRWDKGDVVVTAPAGLDLVAYRDPFVIGDADVGWRMFVGAALADGTAAALTYVSADLEAWEYDGVAAQRSSTDTDPVWTGALWECPQIFEVDGRHVLVTSVWQADRLYYAAYAVGRLVAGRFRADTWGRLTWGDSYYAPSFFRDGAGRPALMLWLRGVGDPEAGWMGAHSVPYVLHLDGDHLVAEPHPGLTALHRPPADANHVEGSAADASWRGTRLDVLSAGRVVASFVRDRDTLLIEVAGVEHVMPASDELVRVLVDGPILEVATGAGIFAAALDGVGATLEFVGDGILSVNAVDPR